jgi:hypothetical protein
MSLEEKTKKWGCYHCSCCRFYHGFAKGCELPGCAYILVSVAQQEIDKLKTFRDNAYTKWCDSQAELERERDSQKQKLQAFYDTLVAMVPKTVKIDEYDKGTKESWIVQTADPSEWSMFIDSLDGWLVKFKEMLK